MVVRSKNTVPPPAYSAMAPDTSTTAHKIIIGVDFGTTFTGISWVSTEGAHVKVLDDVYCINDWPGPGRDGDYSWKAPTRIAYAEDNSTLTTNAWGYEVLPRMKSYAWMKLLLDSAAATKFDDPALEITQGEGVLSKPINKTAVDICADFLAEVARFAFQSLARRISPEVLKATPLDFWFTVPAVWSDKAKHDTLRAAQKAAKQAQLKAHPDSHVFLIREPEAAAVAVLSALTQGESSQHVKVGDSILVCDCGGGTVDLTSYEITAVTPKLAFKELVAGNGGKCGSTYIDREFIKWMESKFGNAYTSLPWEKRGPASRLMKDFEGHKRDFGKSRDVRRVYELQLFMKKASDSAFYDEDEGIVKLNYIDLKRMFDTVVNKIQALLQAQLDAELRQNGKVSIKTILLVGGFGDSAYLNNELREWCERRDLRLICPENPQSAIVRGAAFSGLHSIQPSSRRSRFHYGFTVHEAFDPMRHNKKDRFIWDWDGTARARDNMDWHLAKGDIVNETTEIETTSWFTMYEDEKQNAFPMDIYTSDQDDAPYHKRQGGVRKLASINLDLSGVDVNRHEYRMVDGRVLRRFDIQYKVQFGHRRGVLIFLVFVNGKDVGNTTVTFDGSSAAPSISGPGGNGGSSPLCAMQ